MSSTEQTTQKYPIETVDQPPDIIPNNGVWTCYFLPDGVDRKERDRLGCRQRNKGMRNETCSKCGNKRGDDAMANKGRNTSGDGKRGRLWWLEGHDEEGNELWTHNFIID